MTFWPDIGVDVFELFCTHVTLSTMALLHSK
jgi:hypothetical protein